jgi:K+-transporting ATPase A subunit
MMLIALSGVRAKNQMFQTDFKKIKHLTGQRQSHPRRGPVAGLESIKNLGVSTLTPNISIALL